jgi:hypothetical protein
VFHNLNLVYIRGFLRRRGRRSLSGCCTKSVRCAPRCDSMPSSRCCAPPASPETGFCAENLRRTRWVLWGAGIFGAGCCGRFPPGQHAHHHCCPFFAELGDVLHARTVRLQPYSPGQICALWGGVWNGIPSVEGDRGVAHHLRIITRAVLVYMMSSGWRWGAGIDARMPGASSAIFGGGVGRGLCGRSRAVLISSELRVVL